MPAKKILIALAVCIAFTTPPWPQQACVAPPSGIVH